jgi:hypothetical protein
MHYIVKNLQKLRCVQLLAAAVKAAVDMRIDYSSSCCPD